jgi:hypothetical protein
MDGFNRLLTEISLSVNYKNELSEGGIRRTFQNLGTGRLNKNFGLVKSSHGSKRRLVEGLKLWQS